MAGHARSKAAYETQAKFCEAQLKFNEEFRRFQAEVRSELEINAHHQSQINKGIAELKSKMGLVRSQLGEVLNLLQLRSEGTETPIGQINSNRDEPTNGSVVDQLHALDVALEDDSKFNEALPLLLVEKTDGDDRNAGNVDNGGGVLPFTDLESIFGSGGDATVNRSVNCSLRAWTEEVTSGLEVDLGKIGVNRENACSDDKEKGLQEKDLEVEEQKNQAKFHEACGTIPESPAETGKVAEGENGQTPQKEAVESLKLKSWPAYTSVEKLDLKNPPDQLQNLAKGCEKPVDSADVQEHTPCRRNTERVFPNSNGGDRVMENSNGMQSQVSDQPDHYSEESFKTAETPTDKDLIPEASKHMSIDVIGVNRGMASNKNDLNSFLVEDGQSLADLYLFCENNLMYVAFGGCKHVILLIDNVVMFIFDPGGYSLHHTACGLLELNGEHGNYCLETAASVVDRAYELVCSSSFDNGIVVIEWTVFIGDPGLCAIFIYILEDKDVFKRVGKRMIPMGIQLARICRVTYSSSSCSWLRRLENEDKANEDSGLENEENEELWSSTLITHLAIKIDEGSDKNFEIKVGYGLTIEIKYFWCCVSNVFQIFMIDDNRVLVKLVVNGFSCCINRVGLAAHITLKVAPYKTEVPAFMKSVCDLNNASCQAKGLSWGVTDEAIFSICPRSILEVDAVDDKAFDSWLLTRNLHVGMLYDSFHYHEERFKKGSQAGCSNRGYNLGVFCMGSRPHLDFSSHHLEIQTFPQATWGDFFFPSSTSNFQSLYNLEDKVVVKRRGLS